MYKVLIEVSLKAVKIPRQFISSSINAVGCYVTKINMATNSSDNSSIFKGKQDRFNGITVDSDLEPRDDREFTKCLEDSLKQWIADEKRAIWFNVHLKQSHWIPVLANNGFKYHRARDEWVSLYRWLPVDQTCNIPPYAHTMLGAGAIVYNKEKDEVLVVKERYSIARPMWKFPGGYVEPGEDIADAVQREVMEETGIDAEFKHLLTLRHIHKVAFGCSDLYMVACLTPRTFEINKCDRELTECKWMKLDEYVAHPDVHDNNRMVAEKFVEYKKHGTAFAVHTAVHPTIKKPISMFTLSKIDD